MVDKHRHAHFGGQIIDRQHGRIVGARWLAVGQGREVVVAAHDFADARDPAGKFLQQAAQQRRGIHVVGIDAAHKRQKAPAHVFRRFAEMLEQQEVRTAVVIAAGVVGHVVFGLLRR